MPKHSLPHEFHDGVSETASGVQVTENDASLLALIEALEEKLEASKSVERKSLVIAGEETRTNTGYGTMGTPDSLSVTLTGRGLIRVGFDALIKESVASAARAAIFINENQLVVPSSVSAGVANAAAQSILIGATTSFYKVSSCPSGLILLGAGFSGADVSTGQALGVVNNQAGEGGALQQEVGGTIFQEGSKDLAGGMCEIKGLAAGTYTISIRTKSTSGSVALKARTLYVEAAAFA